jgi:hypothetical protein
MKGVATLSKALERRPQKDIRSMQYSSRLLVHTSDRASRRYVLSRDRQKVKLDSRRLLCRGGAWMGADLKVGCFPEAVLEMVEADRSRIRDSGFPASEVELGRSSAK